jgi:hypothetical protein
MSELGQKHELPRRSIAVRFAPNKQTPTRRVRCDAKCHFQTGAGAAKASENLGPQAWRWCELAESARAQVPALIGRSLDQEGLKRALQAYLACQ